MAICVLQHYLSSAEAVVNYVSANSQCKQVYIPLLLYGVLLGSITLLL